MLSLLQGQPLRPYRSFVVQGVILALLVVAPFNPVLAQESTSGAIPIADLLLKDGTLDLTGGTSGSVKLDGYDLTIGPDGTPVFERSAPPNLEEGQDVIADIRSANGPVSALAVIENSALSEVGSLTMMGNISEPLTGGGWDSEFGNPGIPGPSDVVREIVVSDGSLYVGGEFTLIGGIEANGVARWDGTAWHSLGTGETNGVSFHLASGVHALAVLGTDLYVGGQFNHAGGKWVNHIARWDGAEWHALRPGDTPGINLTGGGSGVGVFTLAVRGTDLFVGGLFDQAGGQPASNLARWTGTEWHSDPSTYGTSSTVYALAVDGEDLYVGGSFGTAGGQTVNHIARWDGSSWHSLGTGLASSESYPSPQARAIAIVGTDVYVGGWFFRADGVWVNHIARWDGATWHALEDAGSVGLGFSYVFALSATGSDLYVGGTFSHAGPHFVRRIARWDGSSWHSLGSGEQAGVTANWGGPRVLALAASELEVFVGGWFHAAGGSPSIKMARWIPKPVSTEPDPYTRATVMLADIHPNPLTATTHVRFALAEPATVRLEAYDLLGRHVMVIAEDLYPAGRHEVEWSAADLAAGVYVVRMTSGQFSQSRRVTVVR